jgi:hypothetical protein
MTVPVHDRDSTAMLRTESIQTVGAPRNAFAHAL